MAADHPTTAADPLPDWFAAALNTPAVQHLRRRVESGGVLPLRGTPAPAQPFLAAALRQLFPGRPVVVVTEGLKTQEVFHQDVETWLKLASGANQARAAASALSASLLFYPAWETLPHESKLPHADVISERLETLVALSHPASRAASHAPLVVTSVPALLQRTFRAEEIRQRTRTLKKGDRIDPLDLVEWLEDQGYEPEVQVNHKGEIALRGGIVDLFPLTCPWPVRLEFFGDELESLREFDPITQVSREGIETVTIPPGGELGLLKRMVEGAPASLHEPERPPHPGPLPLGGGEGARRAGEGAALASFLDYLPANTIIVLCDPPALDEHAATYAEMVPKGDPFYIDWTSVQERMAEAGLTVVTLSDEGVMGEGDTFDEPGAVGDDAHGLPLLATQERGEGRGEGKSPRKSDSSSQPSPPAAGGEGAGAERIEGHLPARPSATHARLERAHSLPQFLSLDAFRPIAERAPEPQVAETQRREFFAQLHRWIRQGHGVHVFCNNDGERERFREIWKEYGFAEVSREGNEGGEGQILAAPAPAKPSLPSPPSPGLHVHLGALSRGFLCEAAKLIVVTDAEIFGRYKVQRPRRLKSPHAQTSRSLLEIDFTDLQEGDYVVHLEHGIGRYLGLGMMPFASGVKKLEKAAPAPDARQECLVIEYAAREPDQPAPKLYVPVSEAHLVGKYIGAGKARPPLNTLGGGRWQKTKEHAERAVRDLAGELLSIQAARASQAGHAFKPDTTWQREFESSFLYEETPHQWRAINATKGDMEAVKPMDRLICGDVGYGKTEVAIRAAFKAVMDGKQVAILVPTTVLAQQHFNTFRERMADYPVRVELLSRFRTPRETRKVIQDLATGAVDIVIGTHRLVQDDIAFKELGLVVIDEEQRFGVLHKEKFKLLRKLVDVLTLSATPIPRTLHLALTGARDMSTIETPPQDRLPVETIVTEFDERVIRDAILRELNRGGQVFYLHNRVLDIEAVASRLRTLVPKARLAVGHGQMHADDLEEVMTKFVNGEADVLLCTTIIESGIDIPNANTIIIDRADRFGLSELYQLRGRVGRYKHQAFAYLLVPRHARLLTDARKRMSAIKQYSSLGSGFKIAMRDLEIRGAGNLLGAQQSGHITAVGFELYCQLLKQSVAALKGEKVKPRVEVQVRLDFLLLNSGDERGEAQSSKLKAQEKAEEPLNISIPRETATYSTGRPEARSPKPQMRSAPAGIPLRYVADAKQRIELYRKLAEVMDEEDVNKLKGELRDRFGPLPVAVELLLQVSVLKVLASQRDISVIESKEDKLMLTRRGDFVMVGGRFPRLEKKEARARLNEIRRLLLLIH